MSGVPLGMEHILLHDGDDSVLHASSNLPWHDASNVPFAITSPCDTAANLEQLSSPHSFPDASSDVQPFDSNPQHQVNTQNSPPPPSTFPPHGRIMAPRSRSSPLRIEQNSLLLLSDRTAATPRHKRSCSPPEDRRPSKLKRAAQPTAIANPTIRSGTAKGAVGVSKTAIANKKMKEAVLSGSFKPGEKQVLKYQNKIHDLDPQAEFRFGDDWAVFHTVCGKWVRMKQPLDVSRFKDHIYKHCASLALARGALEAGFLSKNWKVETAPLQDVKPTAQGQNRSTKLVPPPIKRTSTLDVWAKKLHWSKVDMKQMQGPKLAAKSNGPTSTVIEPIDVPCGGITVAHDARLPDYLFRTPASNGGARSISVIAMEVFHKEYSKLKKAGKKRVDLQHLHEKSWQNDHAHERVFSTECKHLVCFEDASTAPAEAICSSCVSVLHSKAFKNALAKKLGDPKNAKHTNKRHLTAVLSQLNRNCTMEVRQLLDAKVFVLSRI